MYLLLPGLNANVQRVRNHVFTYTMHIRPGRRHEKPHLSVDVGSVTFIEFKPKNDELVQMKRDNVT